MFFSFLAISSSSKILEFDNPHFNAFGHLSMVTNIWERGPSDEYRKGLITNTKHFYTNLHATWEKKLSIRSELSLFWMLVSTLTNRLYCQGIFFYVHVLCVEDHSIPLMIHSWFITHVQTNKCLFCLLHCCSEHTTVHKQCVYLFVIKSFVLPFFPHSSEANKEK